MKLFAQIGHGMGDKKDSKVGNALGEKIIDGAIFSPKDLQKSTMLDRIAELKESYPEAELLIDPQFYLSLYALLPQINLGKVDDWVSFRSYRKSELEITESVDKILKSYYAEISEMNVDAIIAPSIYISQSLDSREAVIAKNFIRRAKTVYQGEKPVYASLAICREALQDQRELAEFLNDITMLSNPPDGFYLIVGSRSTEVRTDIFHADVIASWMMINYSLSVNGFKVINGYSDIIAPFLGAVGGYAGATGWYSNLRMFSMERFFPSGGGRTPIIRYLSKLLLNRIRWDEKDSLSRFIPEITNGLPHDKDYAPDTKLANEALQTWEALKSLIDEMSPSIAACEKAVRDAGSAYDRLYAQGLQLDPKSRDEHIEALSEGIRLFKERAQIAS